MRQLVADFREMIAEQIQYRELLYQMTKRDLLLRYKQTIMGFGWAVFNPLLNTALFSIIFVTVAPLETAQPYILFSYCGNLAWNFSASTFRTSVTSLTSNAGLVTKVFFPREIFPFSAMLVALVDMAVGSSVLIALMAWFHWAPSPFLVFLPFVILIHAAFTAAVSLLIAMGNLFYRDVKYIFEVVIQLGLWASGVAIPPETLHGWARTAMYLNPMTTIIAAYRDSILGPTRPDFVSLGVVGLASFAVLGVAWVTFHRSEFEFAERI